jgi:hypothetical protein
MILKELRGHKLDIPNLECEYYAMPLMESEQYLLAKYIFYNKDYGLKSNYEATKIYFHKITNIKNVQIPKKKTQICGTHLVGKLRKRGKLKWKLLESNAKPDNDDFYLPQFRSFIPKEVRGSFKIVIKKLIKTEPTFIEYNIGKKLPIKSVSHSDYITWKFSFLYYLKEGELKLITKILNSADAKINFWIQRAYEQALEEYEIWYKE